VTIYSISLIVGTLAVVAAAISGADYRCGLQSDIYDYTLSFIFGVAGLTELVFALFVRNPRSGGKLVLGAMALFAASFVWFEVVQSSVAHCD
jgi:hypothetical protein